MHTLESFLNSLDFRGVLSPNAAENNDIFHS